MFKLADKFFKDLGLIPLPEQFWKNSIIKKPSNKKISCHATAGEFFNGKDFR